MWFKVTVSTVEARIFVFINSVQLVYLVLVFVLVLWFVVELFALDPQHPKQNLGLGLYQILIWPDIRPKILLDTGYPAG